MMTPTYANQYRVPPGLSYGYTDAGITKVTMYTTSTAGFGVPGSAV